jgi:hypothetical protein
MARRIVQNCRLFDHGPRSFKKLRVLDAGRARGHTGQTAETKIHFIRKGPSKFHPIVGDGPHQGDASAGAVPLLMSGVVSRTGGQAKATMHALLNDRVVERSERIMGGAHKSMGSVLLPNSRWNWCGKLFIENLSGIENSLGIKHPFEVT